jgi:hypothetical protein
MSPTTPPETNPLTATTVVPPMLLSPSRNGGQVTITFSLAGTASTMYRVEFFFNNLVAAPPPVVANGKSNGEVFLPPAVTFTTDAMGMSGTMMVTVTVPAGNSVVATATDLTASTSKGTSMFSNALPV